MPLDLATVQIGEVYDVHMPHQNPRRDNYYGMVVERYAEDAVGVSPIKLKGDMPKERVVTTIRQEALMLPQGRPGRCIMRPFPQYRRWASDPTALLSFNDRHPSVPTGLSLEELARYEESAFILTCTPTYGDYSEEATFRSPFYDYMSGPVRQHVTVFRVVDSTLERKTVGFEPARHYRHILPEGVQFTPIDEGPVLYGHEGLLALGTGIDGDRERTFALDRNRIFAVETRVLQQAGIVPAAN